MKKKTIIILAVSFFVLVIAAGSLTYVAYNPKLEVIVTPIKNEEYSIEFVSLHIDNILPLPRGWNKNYNEYHQKNGEIVKDLQSNQYMAPTNVTVDFKENEGKTFVTYSGTVTRKSDGVTTEYKKELIFDFLLSHNLEIRKV